MALLPLAFGWLVLCIFLLAPRRTIMAKYGISEKSVSESVWAVVEAVNNLDVFNIEYPDSEEVQLELSRKFQSVSEVNFSNYAGAIDGILIWILKPSEEDAANVGCGRKKFFCSRKGKFGLNCQAVSDVRGRILDLSIGLPGTHLIVLHLREAICMRDWRVGCLRTAWFCLVTMRILTRVIWQFHSQTIRLVPRMISIFSILRFVFESSALLEYLFRGGEF